jgi:hypothetical protein
MTEHFGRIFWQKEQARLWVKIFEKLNNVLCRSAYPKPAGELLSQLASTLSPSDYDFFIYLILDGFDQLQAQERHRTDFQNAQDYLDLKQNLKPLARKNKRLGSPFVLPPELLDESYTMTRTARYYEVLIDNPTQSKGGQPEGGTRHTINCIAKVLRKYMTKGKTADIISQIFRDVYGENKSASTLLRRWLD